jgi:phosphoserine phosphatase
MIKAALLDFDGTLVDHDMTELLVELSGKDDEVKKNNQNFHSGLTTGLKGLVSSINLLRGISVTQIDE